MGNKKTLAKYGGNHYGRGLNGSRKKRQKAGDKQVGYVINLDKRPEKWERIQNDFKDTSISLERFSAIQNENGHIGLGNSFKALIQKAKDENMESILILEDDCKPLKNFEKRWLYTKEWLNNNKDKWSVFNGSAKDPHDTLVIHKFDNKNSLKTMSKGKYATMMLIKNDAYDKILEWDWDKHWLFDFNFVNNSDHFKNIFIDPPLALQYSGFSNTERITKDYTHEDSGKISEVESQEGGNDNEKIHVLTVSTIENDMLKRLIDSGKKYNVNITVLGLEMNNGNLGHNDVKKDKSRKFGMKLALPKAYLKNVDDNDTVIFTDAWDVIYVGSAEEIVRRYKNMNYPIVFGAEKYCWPDSDRMNEFSETKDTAFPYLNSGGYVGKAGAIKKILENYNDTENVNDEKRIDDQRFWIDMYMANKDVIKLDTNAEIFLNACGTNQNFYNIKPNSFVYTETNTSPLLVHANASDKSVLELFKEKYGGGEPNLKEITMGILSWNSCKTLINTLNSYKKNNLLNLINCFIYFQEIGETEKKIAERYNIPYISSNTNIGIIKALIKMIENTKTKYFIFSENDFELIHDANETEKVLSDCIKLLENDDVQVVKLRDLEKPGEPLYSKGFYDTEYKDKPNEKTFPYKLEGLGYIENPEERFPDAYTIIHYNYKWYKCGSKHSKWSNNIFMAKIEWLKSIFIPLIDPAVNNTKNIHYLERNMIDNLKNYNLAAGMGLFTHNRLEREECKDTNIQIAGSKTDAYTISLVDREDRRKTITEKFKNSSINIVMLIVERHPNGAAAGCGDSFMKAIKKAKELNLPSVLIFEDDNMPLDNFDERWKKVKEWLDSNKDKWEVFNGGARIYEGPNIKLKYKVDNDINLFELSTFFGTNWIYIHSDVYDKCLEWTIEKNGPIDRYLGNNSIFKNLCIYPYLGLQEVGVSNSWGKHMNLSNNDRRMKDILEKEVEKQKNMIGGNDTVYIKKTDIAETEALYPFLKNIYENKKIEFVDNREKYDLIVVSCLNGVPQDQKYILICGERYYRINNDHINNQNCIAIFLTSQHPDTKNLKNYYYFPLFLTIGHEIYNSSPFIKGFSDTPKTYLCAFIARGETEARTNMFKALLTEDKTSTTHALGSALHNKDVTLPQFWWDLPQVYKDYKFMFAIENNDEVGYITEKIMNGYRSSSIPIYWGTEKVKEIFNPESFIYIKDYKKEDGTIDYEACAKEIVAIANDEERYNKMKNAPIFNKNEDPEFSKFYDSPSPKWVIDIANDIKKRLTPMTGGSKYKRITRKKKKSLKKRLKNIVGGNNKEISCLFPAYLPSVNAGAEQMAHAINKYLLSKGYTINVIGSWDTQQYDGLNLISNSDNKKVNEAIDRSSILVTQQNSSDYGVDLAKEKNKFLVIIVHNTQRNFYDLEKFKTKLDPSKLFVVFNSEWVKNDFNIKLNSMVLYPPVNCNEYKVESSHEYVTLINVSELKGGNQFIEIAKKMPDIKFLGVEGGYDDQIKNLNISNLTYIPNTPNIKDDVYSKTDILLMPSSAETWGRTATEALCCGIPVLANSTPGLKENLGSAGIFIDRNSIDEWVKTIRKLKDDRNYYNEISNKCKERSSEIMKNTETQFEELYNKLENIQTGGNKQDAYVINVETNKIRWKTIQEDFKDSSFNLIQYKAITSGTPHLGLGLTLVNLIKEAKEKKLETILIFEDDNMPLENFNSNWFIIKEWLDNNRDKWDVFNGGPRFPDWGTYTENTKESQYKKDVELTVSLKNNVHIFKSKTRLLATNWIYINSSIFDKCINYTFEKDSAIDNFLLKPESFKVMFSIPLLGLQHIPTSENTSQSKGLNFNKLDKGILQVFNNILEDINLSKNSDSSKNRDLSGNIRNHLEIIIEWIKNDKKFGIVRPGDGEFSILENRSITTQNNWTFNENSTLKDELLESLSKKLDNLYIGIPNEACSGRNFSHLYEYYIKKLSLPNERKTYSTIFHNENWMFFINFIKSYNSKDIYYVGPGKKETNEINIKGRFNVDDKLVNSWDRDGEKITNDLYNWISDKKNSLICFSVGPITKIWIPKLLEKYPTNIYLDVGSSFDIYVKDEYIKRAYQDNKEVVDISKVCSF